MIHTHTHTHTMIWKITRVVKHRSARCAAVIAVSVATQLQGWCLLIQSKLSWLLNRQLLTQFYSDGRNKTRKKIVINLTFLFFIDLLSNISTPCACADLELVMMMLKIFVMMVLREVTPGMTQPITPSPGLI